MNGNFRSPEFVKRYEYSYFDLQTPLNANVGANNRQTNDNYLFVVDNSSEANPIDWYNSYLEVNFKLLNIKTHLKTKHQIDWDSETCITYSTDYYQLLTVESWFTNLDQTPLNRSQQLPAPYKRLIDEIKQNSAYNDFLSGSVVAAGFPVSFVFPPLEVM